MDYLVGSTGDEEPLVNRWVDWSGLKLLILWEVWKLLSADAGWGVLDGDVGEGDVSWSGLARNELLPSLSALTDDVHGVTVDLSEFKAFGWNSKMLTPCSCTRR